MAKTAILAIKVISDSAKAGRDLDNFGGKASKLEQNMGRATKVAKGVAVGIAGVGVAAFKQASALQQAAGAVDSVFGRQAKQVHGLAKAAASSVGLARSEYSDLAAVLGSQLRNLGVSQDQLVGKTDNLVKLGGDLAATFGGTTADAVSSLSALLRGETDPIERYGVSIKQADIQARLAAKGQDKLKGAALNSAKTQAILELLNKQTAKAQGQRAREAGSAAQAQEVATAKLKNAGATLGAVLLPIFASIADRLGKMAGFVERNQRAFTILTAGAAGLAAAVFAVNGAIAAYTAISKVARVAVIVFRNAQLALNLAMMLNPVGLVIAAIVILIGLVILAYKKSSTFRSIVQGAMKGAGNAVSAVVNWVKQLVTWVKTNAPAAFQKAKQVAGVAFQAITFPIRTVINTVRSLIGWLRENVPAALSRARSAAVSGFNAMIAPIRKAIDWVRELIDKIRSIRIPSIGGALSKLNPFGFAGLGGGGSRPGAPPAAGAGVMARGLVGGARSLSSGTPGTGGSRRSAGGDTFIIQGALDPDAVAKQIQRILDRRRIRVGGISG